MVLREVTPDVKPFRREGTGYVYEPQGVPVGLRYTRIKGNDDPEAEVQVLWQGHHHIRRKIKLLATGSRGSVAELVKELEHDLSGPDWKKLLRDGCESVLENYRRGPELQFVNGQVAPPSPVEWLCDGLILKGKPNCWLGAGATGKSTFAKALCVHYATGLPFLGRRIDQGVPLYLDWEDDRESFERVTSLICRALGLASHPKLGYLAMHGKRLADNTDNIAAYVDRYQIGLIIGDALASAGGPPGEHSTWESVAIGLEDSFGLLRPATFLGIDHVTGEEHRNGRLVVPVKARGAERKYEIFRNQWSLVADQDERAAGRHVVSWYHTKNNAGPYQKPFVVELDYSADELNFSIGGVERSPDAVERLGSKDRVRYEVIQHPGSSAKDLALWSKGDDAEKFVKRTTVELHRLKKDGQARHDQAGLWWPADSANASIERPQLPWG